MPETYLKPYLKPKSPHPPQKRKERKFSGAGGTKPGTPWYPGAIFTEALAPLSEAAPTKPAYMRIPATVCIISKGNSYVRALC